MENENSETGKRLPKKTTYHRAKREVVRKSDVVEE